MKEEGNITLATLSKRDSARTVTITKTGNPGNSIWNPCVGLYERSHESKVKTQLNYGHRDSPAIIQPGLIIRRFPDTVLACAICSSTVRGQHGPRTVPVWQYIVSVL